MDGTLGGAGHAREVCRRLSATGRFIGIDQDEAAIAAAGERLRDFGERVTIIRSNYCDMVPRLQKAGIQSVDGILLDLGVSSYQLDNAERGFTYREDAPLDMRMDQRAELSAYEVVNEYSEEQLFRILRDYGEERFAGKIAGNICTARKNEPIRTTGELTEIIKRSIPAKIRAAGGHPAKRTFQAIRIEVNQELKVLEESLDGMIDILNDGGRICVITFHSLEDRIVKNYFQKKLSIRVHVRRIFRFAYAERNRKGTVITRKPILPGEEEMEANPRSKAQAESVRAKEIVLIQGRLGELWQKKVDRRVDSTRRTERYPTGRLRRRQCARQFSAVPRNGRRTAGGASCQKTETAGQRARACADYSTIF